jgi:hypothetical protein
LAASRITTCVSILNKLKPLSGKPQPGFFVRQANRPLRLPVALFRLVAETFCIISIVVRLGADREVKRSPEKQDHVSVRAQVLAEDHPSVAHFCELFGHHTFFLDGRGLHMTLGPVFISVRKGSRGVSLNEMGEAS